MSYEYYIFALFIFILVCAAILFFARTVHVSKKDKKSTYEKDQKLFMLYQNVEDMLNSFEEYVEETKDELTAKTEEVAAMLKAVEEKTKKTEEDLAGAESEAKKKVEIDLKLEPKEDQKKEVKSESRPMPKVIKKPIQAKTIQKAETTKSATQSKQKPEDVLSELVRKGLSLSEIAKEMGMTSKEVSLMMEIKKIKKTGNKI